MKICSRILAITPAIVIVLSLGCATIEKPKEKEAVVEKPKALDLAKEKPVIIEEPKLEIRDLAPDFKLQNLRKSTFTLSSYRNKQPVLLFFWTTWCPFCRREIKALKDMYPQLVKDNWEIFAIDVGEPGYRVEGFIDRYAIVFNILLDETAKVSESFELLGVPTYVLINKNGQVVFKGHSFPQEEYKALNSK